MFTMSGSSPAPSCKRSAAPVGPTSTIATSSGNVWEKPFSVTFTLPGVEDIVPETPETVIVDGYGDAVLRSFIAIVFELLNMLCAMPRRKEIKQQPQSR